MVHISTVGGVLSGFQCGVLSLLRLLHQSSVQDAVRSCDLGALLVLLKMLCLERAAEQTSVAVPGSASQYLCRDMFLVE